MSQPLPDANITKVMGLLQILQQHGGEHETVSIASDVHLDAESLLPITEAAELLGFVAISGGRVKVTEEGRKAVSGGIRDRRTAVRKRLLTLAIFKRVLELLQSNQGITRKAFHKMLLEEMPKRQADATLKTLIAWGRHAGLVGYDSDNDRLFLVEVETH